MTVLTQAVEIPQPPPRMILGNLLELRRKSCLIESMMDLAREYGPIFQLQLPMGRQIIVTGPELVNELCDDERFDKFLGPGLRLIRSRIGDGLFTAYTDEKNWGKAHRILMPPFSQASMKAYLPEMLDIANQLMESLERHAAQDTPVDVPDVMTRLTLDTIALCAFSHRFDSFGRAEPDPFVRAMVTVLSEQQKASARPAMLNKLMVGARRRTDQAQEVMRSVVADIIASRRSSNSGQHHDLLQLMLTGVDSKTGEGLDEANIVSQCITFLVAGHETTSGLLSFATYFLIKNPDVLARACEEVDRVLGSDPSVPPTLEQLRELRYVRQVLDESLRLWPTAPAFNRGPRQDTLLGGKYFIPKGQGCLVLTPILHRAPSVWGADAEVFNPDHFSPEAEAKRPPNTFLAFGTGARACIGRQFAMQEATLVMGMLLQRFRPVDFANYQLRLKQTLTIKPADLHVKVQKRTDHKLTPRKAESAARAQAPPMPSAPSATGVALSVLFGSNLGSCEGLAHQLAAQAGGQGFQVKCSSLDEASGHLSTEGAVVIICSSYNGTPPDNAGQFLDWLESPELGARGLAGVRYAVFGCGNKDWVNTYQAVPRKLDALLEGHGATRLCERGEGEASGDMDADFRTWSAGLWSSLASALNLSPPVSVVPVQPSLQVEILEQEHPNPFAEVYQAVPMVVVENRELQASDSPRSTRHIELVLPDGVSYAAGDHLGVVAQNSDEEVARVAACFALTPETRIRIRQGAQGRSSLPSDEILSLGSVLKHYVELHETASRHQVGLLASCATSQAEKQRLEKLACDEAAYFEEVRKRSRSLVDLMLDFPSVRLPLARYLEMVPALRPRYYSISSSPLSSGRILSITVGVVSGPARSGHGRFQGSCSSYLAGVTRGGTIHAFLQAAPNFRAPAPATPLVLIGAGTGLAPLRGFLQERAAQKAAGSQLGQALLFFGCRDAAQDYLYRDELEGFERQGIVQVLPAFSRSDPSRKVYVQDRVLEQADLVWQVLQAEGAVYVCGDAAGMSAGVRGALASIASSKLGLSQEQAEGWLDQLAAQGRYSLDVWASS